MAFLYNLARMTVSGTPGTGTITLGSAASGYLSFANAGIVDGDTVSYGIQDGANSEVGRGVYTASGTTLTRSVLRSTNAHAAISATSSAQVFITALAEDFRTIDCGTVTTAVTGVQINQTFNNAAVSFPGVLVVNCTNTASELYSSILLDCKASGVPILRASAKGLFTFNTYMTGGDPTIDFNNISGDADSRIVFRGKINSAVVFNWGCYGDGSGGPGLGTASELYFSTAAMPVTFYPRGGAQSFAIDNTGVTSGVQINLAAGTTSIAPLKFQSGTNLTTAAAGAAEYDGNQLYFSPAASDRRGIPLVAAIRQHATYTLANSGAVQKLFNGSANGRITLPVGTYFFEALASLTAMSATSGNAAFSIEPGTGVVTNFLHFATAFEGGTATIGAWQSAMAITKIQPQPMATAGTGTTMQFIVRGSFEVSTAGTVIPSITLGTAVATAVVAIGSYFMCWRMGATTDVVVGNWS